LQTNPGVSFRAVVLAVIRRVFDLTDWTGRGAVIAHAIKVIRFGWNIVEELHRLSKISTIDPRAKNNPYIAVSMVYTAINVSDAEATRIWD